MRILEVSLRSFRGFEQTTVRPKGHVVLVGEPGAGRSDLILGLERVLSPNGLRSPPTELDFFRRDLSTRPEVEVVLGELGAEIEQAFIDQLEPWHRKDQRIVQTLADPTHLDRAEYDFVVRLAYRIRWNADEEMAEHWVDYPKTSDPENGVFTRIGRDARERFPFAAVRQGRVFDLRRSSEFRALVDAQPDADFESALTGFTEGVADLVRRLGQRPELASALELVLAPLRSTLRLGTTTSTDVVSFVLEGDRAHDLLKPFVATVDLGHSTGAFALPAHGTTLNELLSVAQAMACAATAGSVVVVDDFGDKLDDSAAQYLAARLRSQAAQVWLSTRRSKIAEVFGPDELVRLARDSNGRRTVHQGATPATKAERVAARHRNSQLLPAMSARAVVVVEGPHDRAAYGALATRLMAEGQMNGFPPAHGIQLADAGSEGGSSVVPKLTAAARQFGLRTIALVDHDKDDQQAQEEMRQLLGNADAVIQLPNNHAIEHALLSGLTEVQIREVLADLRRLVPEVPDVSRQAGAELLRNVRHAIKTHRLHAHFIDALPQGVFPPVARKALELAIGAAFHVQTTGLHRATI